MSRKIQRRQLLSGTAALIGSTFVPRFAAAAGPVIVVPPAPPARVAVVKDSYFGETLSDPYRWMENDKDPDWLPFLKAQNDRTRAVLDCRSARPS